MKGNGVVVSRELFSPDLIVNNTEVQDCETIAINANDIFKITYFLKLKSNESKSIQIKSALPKPLRNGDFIARTFRPFLTYFPNSFMCKFSKGMSYITVSNPTSKTLSLKGVNCIGSISLRQ